MSESKLLLRSNVPVKKSLAWEGEGDEAVLVDVDPHGKPDAYVDIWEGEGVAFALFAMRQGSFEDIVWFAQEFGVIAEGATRRQWRAAIEDMRSRVTAWTTRQEVELFDSLGEVPARFYVAHARSSDRSSKSQTIEVSELLPALKLQFNLAVLRGCRLKFCMMCGRPMLIEPPYYRERRYCSEACNSRAYRERKKEAKSGAPKKRKQPKTKGTGRGRSPKK